MPDPKKLTGTKAADKVFKEGDYSDQSPAAKQARLEQSRIDYSNYTSERHGQETGRYPTGETADAMVDLDNRTHLAPERRAASMAGNMFRLPTERAATEKRDSRVAEYLDTANKSAALGLAAMAHPASGTAAALGGLGAGYRLGQQGREFVDESIAGGQAGSTAGAIAGEPPISVPRVRWAGDSPPAPPVSQPPAPANVPSGFMMNPIEWAQERGRFEGAGEVMGRQNGKEDANDPNMAGLFATEAKR